MDGPSEFALLVLRSIALRGDVIDYVRRILKEVALRPAVFDMLRSYDGPRTKAERVVEDQRWGEFAMRLATNFAAVVSATSSLGFMPRLLLQICRFLKAKERSRPSLLANDRQCVPCLFMCLATHARKH